MSLSWLLPSAAKHVYMLPLQLSDLILNLMVNGKYTGYASNTHSFSVYLPLDIHIFPIAYTHM